MFQCGINNSPSSKLILQLTQLATQLIADFDHLSNSIEMSTVTFIALRNAINYSDWHTKYKKGYEIENEDMTKSKIQTLSVIYMLYKE